MAASDNSSPAQTVPGASPPPADETRLVERARQGNLDAFTDLVNRYEGKIFRLTQHITGNREDAEDALQETFLKAYSRLDQFHGDSRFYTWLVRIAVNESLMKLRKRKSTAAVSLDEPIESDGDFMPREVASWDPSPEERYAQIELRGILDRTVQALPPIFRTVFILRDLDHLSTEETAQALDISVPAVKSRLLRARLQLREDLTRYFKRGDGKAASPADKAGEKSAPRSENRPQERPTGGKVR
jgi:RNA polymerase sigma-70 factor (ECF subfamily)